MKINNYTTFIFLLDLSHDCPTELRTEEGSNIVVSPWKIEKKSQNTCLVVCPRKNEDNLKSDI